MIETEQAPERALRHDVCRRSQALRGGGRVFSPRPGKDHPEGDLCGRTREIRGHRHRRAGTHEAAEPLRDLAFEGPRRECTDGAASHQLRRACERTTAKRRR